MAANCAQLRQSLAHLQTQLNVLTNKSGATEEAVKEEKQKKPKSKKGKAEKQAQKVAAQNQAKEPESDASSATKSADETKPSPVQDIAANVATPNADDGEMEDLAQAVSNSNLNAPDLDVANGEVTNEKVLPSINDREETNTVGSSAVASQVKTGEVGVSAEEAQTDCVPESIPAPNPDEEVAQMAESKPIPNPKA